jgi:taurine transport system substrate-binding protein
LRGARKRTPCARAVLALLCALPWLCSTVTAEPVRVGYVTGVEPAKAGISDGTYDRSLGQAVEWRRFDNGAEVIRALAARDLDIGNIGSSVVAVAVSQQLPIETFLIASELGNSEALVARAGRGVRQPADLKGRTIAVPFVTTAHYSLMAALKHWQIPRDGVRIVNLRISEIPAAWASGNIDAAYVFDPALGRIKADGIVLATSTDVANWGAPTYDVWVVRKDFAQHSPALVAAFAATALASYAQYRANPAAWAAAPANVERLARSTGAQAGDVPMLLAGNRYPIASEQVDLLVQQFPKALADTAAFLKEQGKVGSVLTNYHAFSSARFLPTSAGTVR